MMAGCARGVIAALVLLLGSATGHAQSITRFPAPGVQTEALSIHAATDLYALRPLIADFQKLFPGVVVEMVEYVTNDLFAAAKEACTKKQHLGDVYLSSAVDQLVKLANDGCARRISGPNLTSAARWANWRDEVFGFTFEPIVMAFNRNTMKPADMPRGHLELAELLRREPNTYTGRVGTYDIRLSGIGYLLAFNDARQTTTTYGRLLESLGRARVVVRCCTSEILDEIAAGRVLIGYNLLASYAYERVRRGEPIGIVMPSDYTLVLSRGAMVPSTAHQDAIAARFIDYLLSARGRAVGKAEAFFFAADGAPPGGIEGPNIVTSGIARPIAIGPALLAVQDAARRERFLEDWTRTIAQPAP